MGCIIPVELTGGVASTDTVAGCVIPVELTGGGASTDTVAGCVIPVELAGSGTAGLTDGGIAVVGELAGSGTAGLTDEGVAPTVVVVKATGTDTAVGWVTTPECSHARAHDRRCRRRRRGHRR